MKGIEDMALNVNKYMVLAIFKKDTYAGETTYTLEKVYGGVFDVAELDKYKTYEYEIRLCNLKDVEM